MEKLDLDFLSKAADGEQVADECAQPSGSFPKETPLAMAYVPYQMWEKPYDVQTGHSRGTIFPSLDKPFIGEEAAGGVK